MLGTMATFLLLVAAGCGGTKPHSPKIAPSPGVRTAAAIRSRLEQAGYTIEEHTGEAVIGGPVLPKPRGEVVAFGVEVDFTSPNSFKFDVDVFETHRDLERWLTTERVDLARSLARCRLIPRCRLSLKRDGIPKPPTERVVGRAVYSAATDIYGKKLPVAKFEALVALAAGLKS